jgi:hypothetical protein
MIHIFSQKWDQFNFYGSLTDSVGKSKIGISQTADWQEFRPKEV